MSDHSKLPAKFDDLEKFVPTWAHGTEAERNRARLNSSMAEIKELYSAMLPRVRDALTYLDQFPLDAMPEPEQRLFNLCLALVEVGNAVDYYGQPKVKGGAGGAGYDHTRLIKEKLIFHDDRCERRAP